MVRSFVRPFVRLFVRSCVIQFAFAPFTLTVHINTIYNENVQRQEQHSSGINTITEKISTKLHISIFNVRQQFMKLGSLLNVRCRHRSVNCEPCKFFFLKFVYFFTKNAECYGIALDGYNERVHRKKQHARFSFRIEKSNPISLNHV